MYHCGNSALHYSIKSEFLRFNTFMCNITHSSVAFIFQASNLKKKVTMDHLTLFHNEPSCDLKLLSHLQIDKSKCVWKGGIKEGRKGSFIFSNSLFSKSLELKINK